MTVTREVPHGTVRGYVTYGCRCPKCKAARAADQRARGGNLRVGRRAEQKRRADENLKHPCESCGALCHRRARVCHACQRAAVRAQQEKVERLWATGMPARDIGREMGWTMRNPGAHISGLRARGYDLPPRRVLSAEHLAKLVANIKRARQKALA